MIGIAGCMSQISVEAHTTKDGANGLPGFLRGDCLRGSMRRPKIDSRASTSPPPNSFGCVTVTSMSPHLRLWCLTFIDERCLPILLVGAFFRPCLCVLYAFEFRFRVRPCRNGWEMVKRRTPHPELGYPDDSEGFIIPWTKCLSHRHLDSL